MSTVRRRTSSAPAAPGGAGLRGRPWAVLLIGTWVLMLLPALARPTQAQAVISVPSQASTIQDAFFFVGPGDIIEVAPGNYFETVDFFGLSVTLRSSGGAGVTTINATGSGQAAVRIAGTGPGTVLEGFTIRGGDGTGGLGWGGGLEIDGATVLVKDCVIANNVADSGGGVAVFSGSDASFEGCTLRGNHADTNGGGAYVNNASATFTDCVIRKNTADSGGGGLNANIGGELEMIGCRILKNTSANSGGGIQTITGTAVDVTLTGCSIEENSAAQAGGMGVNISNVTITDCDFLNNVSTAMFTSGGGLQAQGSGTLDVMDSRFTGNRAESGGGIHFIAYSGTATVSNCDFAENVAVSGGGGISVSSNSSGGTITGCSFSNNTALFGGGVQNSAGTNLAIGTTFTCGNSPDGISGVFSDQGGNTSSALCTGWTNLGYGHAGTDGVPLFEGTGILSVGQPGALTLSGARPSALAVLFVSFANLPTPFFGGTLVPVPPQLELSFTTDGAGGIALPFVWPSGVPAGFDIYQQYGIDDPAAVGGVALSNALKSEAL